MKRHYERMAVVTRDQVQAIGRHVRREMRDASPMAIRAAVAKRIVERFVGQDWTARHLSTTSNGFFHGYGNPTVQDNAGARRLIELAEMLLNLQSVAGFEDPQGKLRTDDAEAAFGAFEAAKLLHRSRTRFEFVVARGVPGEDYDIEAFPENGPAVPIEAKCKLVGTAPSESGMRSTLEWAKKHQLPPNRPGVVILRIPREWGGDEVLLNQFGQAAERAMRGSSRIAGIIVPV